MRTLLQGATVVDGTRAPARQVDVLVDRDLIVEVGSPSGADRAVDLNGLVLAPGFIDPHTHYDAQVLWDPDVTPSSWHGVTTVVTGNTGFTLAPNVPDVRDLLVEMLTMVEGMPKDSLKAGIDWSFSSFDEYLTAVQSRPLRINVAAMVGHSTVRYAVMGADAMERAATAEELGAMRALVADAIDAGAIGFSSSRSTSHVGAESRPVPSRVGELSEIWALAEALREARTGVIEVTWGPDLFVDDVARLSVDTGRPVSWAAVLTQRGRPQWTRDIVERTAALGGDVFPQIACKPVQVQIDLSRPGSMAVLPSFAAATTAPAAERIRRFADPGWRAVARTEVEAHGDWSDRLRRAVVQVSPLHPDLVGRTLEALAGERGMTPLDLLLDLVVADQLATRFSVVVMNDEVLEVAGLLLNDRLMLGLGDGGAHTAQLCDADSPTYLLAHWVREREILSLEDAVWRLSGQPASVFKLHGRGRVAEGYVADLVAFDPETVGGGPMERWADLPGGSERLVVPSVGVEHMWVRGEQVRCDQKPVDGVSPGIVLRGGRG